MIPLSARSCLCVVPLVLFSQMLMFGCRSGPQAPATQKPTLLEPIHIRAARDGDRINLEAYNADELFEKAGSALRSGRCELALANYQRLVEEFPESGLVPLALYNTGLCNDELGHHEEAAASYARLVGEHPNSDDVTDALFRLAGSYESMEAWENAIPVLDRLLTERTDLRGIERIEALARKGSAMIAIGQSEEARWVLEEATRLYRAGRGLSASDSVFHYSMAQFKLGEIVQNEMRKVPLPSDETLLEDHLERKAQHLLQAQRLYTKVIRIGHPHWAAAAAYRIGSLYHHLWKDMLSAPPPEDLTGEAQEIYFEILRNKVRVLLKKAVLQWERTLKLAVRLGLDNEWIDSTTNDLEEIRKILVIEKANEELKKKETP